MKWVKYISHPHIYIVFFIFISVLSFIPNGLGWRHNMEGLIQNYLWLYIAYIVFYFFGYYSTKKPKPPEEKTEISFSMINRFHLIFIICAVFFILKFIYISGIPIFSGDMFLRTKLATLGGFVDYPTKAISILGIVAYYFYLKKKNNLYLAQFILSIVFNLLFAERSLIVFTILGAVILYVNFNSISKKTFKRVLISFLLMFFVIGGVQIMRHGGKKHLNRSGKMSTFEVVSWVVHGDLTGSQKFGAYVTNELGEERLHGRYTLGIFLSIFIPNYKNHGATYLQKRYSIRRVTTAQSASIPYSYYMDFGMFSLIFPFFIGVFAKKFYERFRYLNSPLHIILYPALFFNLLWSVRAGNFPVDPKLIYFILLLFFVFNPPFKYRFNNEVSQVFRFLFLLSIGVSILALIIRW
ncbi:MAG: oligosaccharide repeat unit polymerase [Flavobacteriaceae bacterium]|nr:oligosaccharide repeat unit polymerase [Flavobacteriaceae bacterium]